MVRLLVVLVMATAFVFEGGMALAQTNPNADLAEIVVANAQRLVLKNRAAVEQIRPLPALPVPPIMTDRGMVQAPNPRPLESFPLAKHQPAEKPQQVAKPLPAIKTPPVETEKGKVETPNPRPTADFPQAKPQEKAPVADIKRSKGFLDGKAVVVNQENIHVNVMLSASNNLGRKVAIEVKPGEYALLIGTLNGWEPEKNKSLVKEVPRGYEIVKGKEGKS